MDTSAEARVIAAFTFIVVLMLGAWGSLDNLFTTSLFTPEIGRLIIAALPFAATAVAFQSAKATQVAWARALGNAAVMLGGLSCLGAVLYFLANT